MGLQPTGWRRARCGYLLRVEQHGDGLVLTLRSDLHNASWVTCGLTPDEARDLAEWLLEEAQARDERLARTEDG